MKAYVSYKNDSILALVFDKQYSVPEMLEVEVPEEYIKEEVDNPLAEKVIILTGLLGDYTVTDGTLVYTGAASSYENTQRQLAELYDNLNATDYVVTKLAEYNISGMALSDEDADRYTSILEQREQWRSQINELEAQNG